MMTEQNKLNHKDGSVITFYSYKGGVGRSMALANLACLLSKIGKDVLLIDWDLEAPGLHHFFKEDIANKEQLGLIDLMTEIKAKLDTKVMENDEKAFVEYLENNLDLYINKDLSVEFSTKISYPINLIKSGRFNIDYTTKLIEFDWIQFYKDYPSFFRTFAYYLESKYDYVLIDSRTGFADTSGICTMLLPERLVLLFSPNEQNIEGVLDVAKQARKYRIDSYDERTLTIYPLPARIDGQSPATQLIWRERYKDVFEEFYRENYYLVECSLNNYFANASIRYVHEYAYGENLPVLKEEITENKFISNDYYNFLNILLNDEPIWKIPSIEELALTESTYQIYISSGLKYELNQEYDKAILEYTKAIELRSFCSIAYYNRGSIFFKLMRYEEAITDYTKAIKIKSDDPEIVVNRGIAFLKMQKHIHAIDDFNKAIKLKPDYIDAYYNRGNTYLDLKQYIESIAEYNKVLSLNPDYAPAYYRRGNVFSNLQKYYDAITDYNKAIYLNPDDAEAYHSRGCIYIELTRYNEAIADFETVIKLKPNKAEAFDKFGLIYYNLKNFEKAIDNFTKAIKLKPIFADPYNNRGNVLKELKSYNEAIADYKKAVELNPDYAEAYNSRGTIYNELKMYDEAITDFNKAIELKPEYAESYYKRGSAFYYKQKYDEAIANYSEAIQLKQYYPAAYYNRGTAYCHIQKCDDAIVDYIKAIQFMPFDTSSYNNLGYVYLYIKDYSNAEINFKKCLEMDPKKFDSMIGLSILYYELQKYSNSKSWLIKAIRTNAILNEGMKGVAKLEEEGSMFYSKENKETLEKIFARI